MSCKVCGYAYWYKGEQYPTEVCPNCGHYGEFREFVDGVENAKETGT